LHGHSFWVVGRGSGNYDAERDVPNYNLENPTLRDTVTLWPLERVAVRFVANNPGTWLFHCHITAHLVMGMGFALVVSPDEIGTPSKVQAYVDNKAWKKGVLQTLAMVMVAAAARRKCLSWVDWQLYLDLFYPC
jgi:hypothetical protein